MSGRKICSNGDNLVRRAMGWVILLACLLVALPAGCAPDSDWSPTGHHDDGTMVPVAVSESWEGAVFRLSQDSVKRRLENADTAVFTTYPQFSAYYDQRQRVTRMQVYGLVQTSTVYGQHALHRYTVGWQRNGKVDPNDNSPWDPSGTTVVDSY